MLEIKIVIGILILYVFTWLGSTLMLMKWGNL